MPILDLSVEELKKYKGMTPCPDDFDEYWDKALEEVEKIDFDVKTEREEFPSDSAECYHLWFTGTQNARIHARLLLPVKRTGKIPAVLKFHGLSAAARDWFSLLPYAENGICVAALDSRGQGGKSQDTDYVGTTYTTPFIRGLDGPKEDMYQRQCFLDTVILAKIIMGMDFVDENRVGVFGGSQGGGLSVACAALVPQIKRCLTMFPYLSDYKRVWHMDLDNNAYEGIRYYFRNFDPTHEREDEIFTKLGYVDIQNLAKRIRAEVLMMTGLQDKICPPSTQFAMYNKLETKKNVIIAPDFGHEDMYNASDIVFKFFKEL